MSRALRRHPAQQTKKGRRGQRQRPPSVSTAAKRPSPRQAGRGASALRPHWAMEIWSELRKVTWPSREDTWYLTFVVIVVAGAFGVFLGGVDMFFNWFIEQTLLS